MDTLPVVTTTIRLPDDLHHAAKIEAVTRRISLNELFLAAIQKSLPAPKK